MLAQMYRGGAAIAQSVELCTGSVTIHDDRDRVRVGIGETIVVRFTEPGATPLYLVGVLTSECPR